MLFVIASKFVALCTLVFLCVGVMFEAYLFPTRLHRVSSLHDRLSFCHVGAASISRRQAFVHRALRDPLSSRDVSLLLAGDFVRLDQMLLAAELWTGPVVMTLSVLDAASIDEDVAALLAAAMSTFAGELRDRLDVHVIHMDRSAGCGTTELYLFGAAQARTDWLVEVPRGSFLFRDSHEALVRELSRDTAPLPENTVLVVPHFATEWSLRQLPRSKRAVTEAFLTGTVTQANELYCFQCQQPVDIDRWMHASDTAAPYAVQYRWLFQPIAVLHRTMALRRNASLSSHPLEPIAFAAATAGAPARLLVVPVAYAIQSLFESMVGVDEIPAVPDDDALVSMPLLCDYLLRSTQTLEPHLTLPMQCSNVTQWRGQSARNYA
jgi:hypothetical protein